MMVKRNKTYDRSIRTRIMCLRKPTPLGKIIETVPKPSRSKLNFGMPKWKLMPLESKIPMIPGPTDAYTLTRRKLGKKLWEQTRNAEYNLYDPYNYEMELSYEPLHDPHLARYFSRKANINRMIELGFITTDLGVKCSLKDYNMYRQFLKKLHNDNINKKLKRQSNLENEKRILERADLAAQRNIEKLKITARKMLARDKAREVLKQRNEITKQLQQQQAEELKKHRKSIETAKIKAMQERMLKSQARTEEMQRKKTAAAECKRLAVMKKLAKKDAKHRQSRRKRASHDAEKKRRSIEEKWQRKKEEEKEEIAARQSALHYVDQERQHFITNYMKKVERHRACMQKRFKKIRRFIGCYINRRFIEHKEISCCQIRKGATNK